MTSDYVITFGRSIGSGGLDVARALGEELGIKVYDKELLVVAAQDRGLCPEMFTARDERATRHLKSLFNFRSVLRGTGNSVPSSIMTDEEMFKMQSDMMRRIASEGPCIFVGRCAEYILRDHPHLFSIFITAPVETRVKRVMKHHGLNEEQALKHIRRIEASRSDYYNYYTFKKWGDSSSYDLCLDIDKIGGVQNALEIIKLAITKSGIEL